METLTAAQFTANQRRRFAQDGIAMSDGSFPIRNRSDLGHAIRALGRASNMEAAREHIIRRARDLGLTGQLPQAWGIRASMDGGQVVPEIMLDQVPWWAGADTNGNANYGTLTAGLATQREVDEEAASMLATIVVENVGIAPLVPPTEWFEDPQLDGPTPLTVTADGRVYGHLAEFGKCHRGIQGRCVMPPRTKNGYQHFNTGAILTADGSQVRVGKLTVNAHHAPMNVRPGAAAAHYDHTGAVAAFVRAGEDEFGPWLAGATKSDATPEQIRDLRANAPSGDWRNTEGRGLELVAALAVPVPGFPIMAVTASAHGEVAEALILAWGSSEELAICASGFEPVDEGARIKALAARITGGIDGLAAMFR